MYVCMYVVGWVGGWAGGLAGWMELADGYTYVHRHDCEHVYTVALRPVVLFNSARQLVSGKTDASLINVELLIPQGESANTIQNYPI